MYRFICCNLSKTNRSLVNFTRSYKQVALKFQNNRQISSNEKQFGSETDLQGIEEGSEVPEVSAKKERLLDSVSKCCTSIFSKKMGMRGVSRSLLSATTVEYAKLPTYNFTNSVRPYFSSIGKDNQHSTPKKKLFKNKEAMDMYKNAIQQCMKIRVKKYSFDKYSKKITWAPQPIRSASWEDKSKGKAPEEEPAVSKVPAPKKHFVYVYPEQQRRFEGTREVTRPIKFHQPRISHQTSRRKFKITYPTHVVKYKLGIHKPHKVEQTESSSKDKSPWGRKVTKPDYAVVQKSHMRGTFKAEPEVQQEDTPREDESKWRMDVAKVNYPVPQNFYMRKTMTQPKHSPMAAVKKEKYSPVQESKTRSTTPKAEEVYIGRRVAGKSMPEKIKYKDEDEEDNWEDDLMKQHPVVKKISKEAKMQLNRNYNKLLLAQRLKESNEHQRSDSATEDLCEKCVKLINWIRSAARWPSRILLLVISFYRLLFATT